MITGDHIDTAVAIAKELGIIKDKNEAITGSRLDELSDEDFDKCVTEYSVYARVQPEHKVKIVKAWQRLGKVTAKTGDGVNDAPAIKNADIGIGMGITGTDVTKNVADMVLADDNFATIVKAVAEGRRIYDNIRKAIQFLLSSNLAEVIAIFVASLMGFTILKPTHLLWINLITDSFPAVGLGMDAAETDIMARPPRDKKEGIFAQGLGAACLIQGFLIAGITLFSYFLGEYLQNGVWSIKQSSEGMTMAFLTLSMAELFHSFNMRSLTKSIFTLKSHNKFLYLTLLGAFLLTLAVLYVPSLSRMFNFQHVSFVEFAVSILIAAAIIPLVEIEKLVTRMKHKK
jgi:Ca2+-transporting ATPase